jgi:hypothetical protein
MKALIKASRDLADEQLLLADRHLAARSVEAALRHYEAAHAAFPESDLGRFNRWKCLALLGRFESAWAETDRFEAERRALSENGDSLPLHFRRIWNGEPLAGKHIHVSCYHGLGDTLQFVRYASLIKRTASRLTIECQPSLIDIVRSVQAVDEIFPLNSKNRGNSGVHCELMELPYIFRTTLEAIPNDVPYLSVCDELLQSTRTQLFSGIFRPGHFNVGIVWTSGDWNPARNIELRLFRTLAEIPNLGLFCLHKDVSDSDRLIGDPWMFFLQNVIPLTITHTAAVIGSLDLVISVDTMAAHLAGALGANVWTLIPFDADWRWMTDRNDTPWYPTMRLFRQTRPGDWSTVIEEVRRKLDVLREDSLKNKPLLRSCL